MPTLRQWNLLAAAAHGASLAGIALAFRNRAPELKRLTMQRITIDPDGDLPEQCTVDYGVKATPAGSLHLDYGILAFFAISCVAHLYYATARSYTLNVGQGWNPYRWIEYGLSAGVMTVLLAGADGIRDYPFALTLGAVTAALQGIGFVTETQLKYSATPNKETIKAAQRVGWLLFAVVWGAIAYSFITAIRDAKTLGRTIPDWLYIVVLSQLIYYALFGLVQIWHIQDRLSGHKRFELHELRYLKLSFASKLTLASGFAYGLIFRTRNC